MIKYYSFIIIGYINKGGRIVDYNLCDYKTLQRLLTPHGFNFSKSLGQNFIIDSSVCPAMAEMLGADENTGVLEIGPGVGVLTKELCKTAGRVVSVELDERLYPVLDKTLEDYDNFKLIKGDCMKIDLLQLMEDEFSQYDSVKVCANLPYYITSPVIMKLLESKLPVEEIEVMVQQEAAERLCAEIGSRNAGAVSVAVKYYGDSEILFNVGRESFMPSPKVDSSVIKITLYKEPKYEVKNEKKFFSLVKIMFAQRRKTILNSLSNGLGISKDKVSSSLVQLSLKPDIRAEKLTMGEIVDLANLLIK